MGRALLLSGRPGLGKTTVIRTVVSRLGRTAGGFYTEEIRERGERTGFRLVAFGAGPDLQGILAGVHVSSAIRVGKYRVDVADLERVGVTALRRSAQAPEVAVIVIDEIGKMEISSAAFRLAVLEALDGPKPVLATVMAAPQPWVDAIKRRPDATLVEVTLTNRQALPEQIMRWLAATQQA